MLSREHSTSPQSVSRHELKKWRKYAVTAEDRPQPNKFYTHEWKNQD
jgi:hypothetical protein